MNKLKIYKQSWAPATSLPLRLYQHGGNDEDEDDGLGELPDEAQFDVSDGEEADGHDAQSQVVLP